ncbi:MAG: LiaI-LiaF-like domain-containing protein [bacterium]
MDELDVIYFRWRHLFPILLLTGSALFFASMASKKEKGAVFPATALLVLGLFFLLRNFDIFSFDYYFYDAHDFWPIFLVAFGLAFIALFFVRSEDWGVLIPGGVLLFLGTVFFLRSAGIFFWRDFADFWPVILIVIGLSIVIGSFKKKA